MGRVRRVSFVVRAVEGKRGEVSGVIEQVATGKKEAFTHIEAIGRVIAAMLQDPRTSPRGARRTAPAGCDKTGPHHRQPIGPAGRDRRSENPTIARSEE